MVSMDVGDEPGFYRNIKNAYSEIEPWTGVLFTLEAWSCTDNPNAVGAGVGVENAQDWTVRRRRASSLGADGTPLDSDELYVRHVLGLESINLIGLLSLAKAFDFGLYRSIFEIGCGDMSQAYIIHRLYPNIHYVATDLDPYVIERCSQLQVLGGIEKRVLDVRSIPDHQLPFEGFDLLMSWGMEYALDDKQLLRLFRMAEGAGLPYLMCSASTIGLIEYARYRMGARRMYALVNQRKLRMTGWRRSIRNFQSLARQAGLEMRALGRFGYHFCMLLNCRRRSE
jgi:hypothetical protein